MHVRNVTTVYQNARYHSPQDFYKSLSVTSVTPTRTHGVTAHKTYKSLSETSVTPTRKHFVIAHKTALKVTSETSVPSVRPQTDTA